MCVCVWICVSAPPSSAHTFDATRQACENIINIHCQRRRRRSHRIGAQKFYTSVPFRQLRTVRAPNHSNDANNISPTAPNPTSQHFTRSCCGGLFTLASFAAIAIAALMHRIVLQTACRNACLRYNRSFLTNTPSDKAPFGPRRTAVTGGPKTTNPQLNGSLAGGAHASSEASRSWLPAAIAVVGKIIQNMLNSQPVLQVYQKRKKSSFQSRRATGAMSCVCNCSACQRGDDTL